MAESNGSSAAQPEQAGATGDSGTHSAPVTRGAFIQLLTATISFVIVAIPAAFGGLFFLDPLLRKRGGAGGAGGAAARKDEEGFIRLDITADVIPSDGLPVAVTVRDDSEDAWNKFLDVPVGSIWLRKDTAGALTAFNSVCPHLGCSVNYRRSENDFYCPCHTSAFSLDGKKMNEVPPRDMDALEVSLRTGGKPDPAGTEVWVKFQNFQRGKAEKKPL